MRDGEWHFLIKWRGCDESANSWVAETALPDTYAIELAASFEEQQEGDGPGVTESWKCDIKSY